MGEHHVDYELSGKVLKIKETIPVQGAIGGDKLILVLLVDQTRCSKTNYLYKYGKMSILAHFQKP